MLNDNEVFPTKGISSAYDISSAHEFTNSTDTLIVLKSVAD